MSSKDSAKRAKTQSAWRARRVAQGLCPKCATPDARPDPGKGTCSECLRKQRALYTRTRETWNARNKRYIDGLRDKAFTAYGGYECSCCGELHREFLTIDHVGGGGAAHRREIGRAPYALFLWMKRNGYPDGFRVLCMNCNFSLGIHGYCPHEE